MWRIVHSVVLRWELRVWDVGLSASCAETAECVSKAILLTSVKMNFIIFVTLSVPAKSLLILRLNLLIPSCIHRRTKQDRQCAYNIFWLVHVTISSNETQQCVVFVLLSYVSLSVNTVHCKTVRLCIMYDAGNNINLFRSSCKAPAISWPILTKESLDSFS